jgi:hypothetical protein
MRVSVCVVVGGERGERCVAYAKGVGLGFVSGCGLVWCGILLMMKHCHSLAKHVQALTFTNASCTSIALNPYNVLMICTHASG